MGHTLTLAAVILWTMTLGLSRVLRVVVSCCATLCHGSDVLCFALLQGEYSG